MNQLGFFFVVFRFLTKKNALWFIFNDFESNKCENHYQLLEDFTI